MQNRHSKLARRSTIVGKIQMLKPKENPYADEEHSLQGKEGKTHSVC
jgi:glutamate decarboxylase